MAVQIELLGPPRVRRDGGSVTFDTRKAVALLAHLALAERPRAREALCELLWPAHDPEGARAALRRTLSTLRRAVGEEWLETSGDSVALRRGAGLELDVERFRELAREGASEDELTEAVRLCSGDLLEGFSLRDSPDFDDWLVAEADALRRELASALGRLAALLAERGEYERAIPHAHRRLEVEPLHEPAHRELIRLYALSGDRGAATRQYRDCVRTLSQELGVAPLDETAALFEQVIEGTLVPPPPPAREAARRADAPRRAELPLAGRANELAALRAAYAAIDRDGRLAAVEGEPGIGKTRLAHELISAVAAEGGVALASRCHEDEAGLPYVPVVELLRQALPAAQAWAGDVAPQRLADASPLVPELGGLQPDLPEPLSLSGPVAQARLLEGVAAVLGAACRGRAPGVVLVDDAHAADGGTLEVLAHLARRLRDWPNLLLVCWRSEGVPPGHRLRRLAAEVAREGAATVVPLARLDEDAVGELVRAAHGQRDAPELESRVYVESEGLPLFVAEYLAALRAGAEPERLPDEVRSLMDARFGALSPIARQMLAAAAVIGRSFAFDLLRAASGRSDEDTVAALEELLAHDLVREAGGPEPAYDFSHQKLREVAYAETSLARRRLLHRRVAGALPRSGEMAALRAQHLRLGGALAEAAEQYRLAAEHAASLHAHADALEHLEAAVALDHPDPAGLRERIGDLRTLIGDYAGALASYETAAAEREGSALAGLEQKLAGVHARLGEWRRSEARLGAALEAAPADALELRARILADLGLTLHHTGSSEEAAARARDALQLARAAADRRAHAQAYNILGVLGRERGDLRGARTELERSLDFARELGDAPAEAAALNNLALVARDAGELERALALTREALERCAAYGDRHRVAALENNLADLHHAAGHGDEAMAHLKRAVALFAEVGGHQATRLPEIWKLVSW